MTDGPAAKPKWTTRRKVLVTLAILLGSTMVLIPAGLFWQLYEANNAFHAFTDALIAKRYQAAYDLTSPELKASADYSTFVKVQDDLARRMGNLQIVNSDNSEVKERSDGWYATVEASLVFDHGSLPFIFVLKKAGRTWQIYNFREQ